MRKLPLALIVLVTLLFASEETMAQFNRKTIRKNNKRIANFKGKKSNFDKSKIYNSLGFTLTALNYYGDIAPRPTRFSSDISFTRPALGIFLNHRFGPRYSFQAQLMYGNLKGSDQESADKSDVESGKYRYQRNASFRNKIIELSAVAVFDLFENESSYISRVAWTPYVYIGVAGFTNNPEAQAPATDLQGNALPEAGKWVKLQPLGTEGQYSTLDAADVNYGIKPYKTIQVAIPFGIGARFRLNQVMDFWADFGFRYTFTDYLDDVSQNYVDLGVLKSPLSQAMSYRTGELADASETYTYTGRDGQSYTVQPGYGSERKGTTDGDPGNVRGSKKDRDIYMVTSLRLTYIIGASFHKAKFR
jgi:hypothetical protein